MSFGLVHASIARHLAAGEDDNDFDWLDRPSMDLAREQTHQGRTFKGMHRPRRDRNALEVGRLCQWLCKHTIVRLAKRETQAGQAEQVNALELAVSTITPTDVVDLTGRLRRSVAKGKERAGLSRTSAAPTSSTRDASRASVHRRLES